MASIFKRNGKGNRDGSYQIAYFDHTGKRITRSARTSDLAAAKRIAAKLEADVALRRERVIDAGLEAISEQAQRLIDDHLADFGAKMAAGGRKAGYIKTTIGYVRSIATASGWSTAADISADAVNRYAGGLREAGQAARTIQAHLTAAKSFARWLANNQKLPRDPLASVTKPDPKGDRRLERRMLLPDEWPWLKAATRNGPVRSDTGGPARAILYALAIQSGLRLNELRSLTRQRLFLDEADPFVTCKAAQTKNAKDARQFIRPDLADELRLHVAATAPQAAIFTIGRRSVPADMLRQDLQAARRDWLEAAKHDPDEYQRREQSDFLLVTNHDGECLDFHSLRHTCGAWLALAGANAKAIQRVMRHSSIELTMGRYGHELPEAEAETVARFPIMMADDPEVLQATGTTDSTAEKAQQKAQQKRQHSGCETARHRARQCGEREGARPTRDHDKPLSIAKQCDPMRNNARHCVSMPGRTPTRGVGIDDHGRVARATIR